MKQTLILNARETRIAKRLVERGYTLPDQVKSGPVTRVHGLVRGLDDAGGMLRLAMGDGEALAGLLSAPMEKFAREFSPAETDAIEHLFVRVEMTFKVKLRSP